MCIFSLSGVGLFFLLFLTSLIYVFHVFVLSLWSLCECDVISCVLILFRFGSVVWVLAREAFSVLFFRFFFLFLCCMSLVEGLVYHPYMPSLRVD